MQSNGKELDSVVMALRGFWSRSLLPVLLSGGVAATVAAQTATTTTLTIVSGGIEQSTVSSGTAVTLNAAVTAGSTPVSPGQVEFCDGSASHCTGIHLLGLAQLTPAGTASLKFIPGIGKHSYQAVFVGTRSYANSSSSSVPLDVTGLYPTTSTIVQSGSAGNYSLMATVVGLGSGTVPTGTVSFLDTSNGNAVLGTAALGANTEGLGWLSASNSPAGSYPESIAVGDFNKDGIPDMAVANSGDGTVSVLLGNGNGTSRQASGSPISVGAAPWAIAVGDFNGDGNSDLAVADYIGESISILLGNGNGTFTEGANSSIPLPQYPISLVTGDFNGDGIADLAIVATPVDTTGTGTVTSFLGNGDGTFTQAPGSPVSLPYPYALATADFNGDGILDLAVVSGYNWAMFLEGNGDGTFTLTNNTIGVGNSPVSIAVGDFNSDGMADLAIANWGDNLVTILVGQGNFAFTRTEIAVGVNPFSIAAGDFNGDGNADLAVANAGSDSITVLLGDGSGAFTQAAGSPLPYSGTPVSLATADLNGDGVADLAVVDQAGDAVTALLSQVTETASAAVSGISPSGSGTNQVETSYPGDGNFMASTSATTALRAVPITPGVTVTPSSSAITTGQVLTVTILISGGSGNPIATGTVVLSGGGYSSGAVALSAGSAVLSVPAGSLAAGTDTLTAAYTPDTNSATTYNSNSGSATVRVTPLPLATPEITVAVSTAKVAISQAVTVQITVAGTAGNPAPTGLVTLMSNNPAPMVYDTFQYPDGTLLNGKTAQSGNSVWNVGGLGVIEGNHLINNAPPDQLGVMNALLPNTTSVGGTLQPVTTVGGTIRMCPSASGTYSPSYTSVGMLAFHDSTDVIEIGIGPTSWWLRKTVHSVNTTLLEGAENLAVDCTSEYTVQMMINQAAGTVQVIPPSGIPSRVITDPDITQIDALYGDWEPENNTPYKYIGEWGSVWLGGGYVSASTPLIGGSATITIPAGSLALGNDTLTATYTPDATSSPIYNGVAGTGSVAVSKVTPSVTVKPSSTSITTIQGVTVTLAVSGSTGAPEPTGTVVLSGNKYTSSTVTLTSGSATIRIPAGVLAAGTDTLTATYIPDARSSAIYNAVADTGSIAVSKVTPSVKAMPSSTSITTIQGVTITVAVSGGTGAPVPTGTVVLSGSGYTSPAVTLTSGSVTIRIPAEVLAAGTDTLTATYTPDTASSTIYNGADGTRSVAVSKLTPSLKVTPPSSRITTTQLFQVLVTVTGGAGGPIPTGAVALANGGYASGRMDLSKGAAAITIPAGALPPSTDIYTVSYSGDSIYSGAEVTGTVAVRQSAVSVTVTPANNGTLVSSQPETVTIIVASVGPTPSGTVALTGGGFSSSAAPLISGSATIDIPANQFTNAGNITLAATYSGDAIYASGSGEESITVNAPYSLTTTNPSPVSPGTDTSAVVTVSANPSYSGSVSLSCVLTDGPSGAQDLPTCSVASGSPVTINNGTASGTVTITIDTTAERTSGLDRSGWATVAGGMVFALLFLMGIPTQRRNWRGFLGLVVVMAVLGSLGACGGRSTSSGNGRGGGSLGTPVGSYTFTVTGKGNPAITPAPAVAVTLTVN